jgi:hypothetical protein
MIPVPPGDVQDTFSSDYSPAALDSMVGINLNNQCSNLHLMMTVFLQLLPIELRSAALKRPTLMGQSVLW